MVKKLKRKKACGHDGILAEHLIWGGDAVLSWLLTILNCIVELEEVPRSMKMGLLSPVFKGRGRDPQLVDSYRGITVTSVIAKVLESLVRDRMGETLFEAGIPHLNQTAYRRHVGCAEALFVMQEVIARYVEEGSPVYLCLYDLQKAYDSVEFPVLLDRLFKAGVNGKTWRLIRDWYQDGVCAVKSDGKVSSCFDVSRGVRQGSVLSPTLFLIVMDPLLRYLEASGAGLTVNGLYVGAYLHADDIRTLGKGRIRLLGRLRRLLPSLGTTFSH